MRFKHRAKLILWIGFGSGKLEKFDAIKVFLPLGVTQLVLSDKDISDKRMPMPMLLCV